MERENTVIYESTSNNIPVLKVLYKNIVLLIMVTVLCTLLGLGYSLAYVKPTYTASRSVMLRTEMESANLANNFELADIFLSTVSEVVKSPTVIKEANDAYLTEGESITASAIGIKQKEESIIFKITYTDRTPELAIEKLDVLFETFANSQILQDTVPAKEAELIPTQRNSTYTSNVGHTKYAILGGVIGLVITAVAVLVVYVLDNTVRDKTEFEELTGVSVIAYINKEKPKKRAK